MPYDKRQEALIDLGYLVAEASKNVVFVVGAGLSVPAGLPLWPRLCNILKDKAREWASTRPEDEQSRLESQLSQLEEYSDLWLLGDALRDLIPGAEYDKVVTHTLTSQDVPTAYSAIWNLAPSGMVTFNLDGCAQRALDPTHEQVATGQDKGRYQRFLLSTKPFILQPHGAVRHPNTWVLGARARNRLLKDPAYRRFVVQLLGSRRLVVVGFRPEDLAFQSLLLDDFRDSFAQGVGHFWICPSPSAQERAFGSLYNLGLIEYEPADGTHDEVVDILSHLGTFRPREGRAPLAYEGEAISPKELPSEEELRKEHPESIRLRLNAAMRGATEGLEESQSELMNAIGGLFSGYSGSMRMAWHVTGEAPYNRLWGHSVEEPLGEGAFSNVWRAVDQVDGQICAIKIMREDILKSPEMYEAFRRGVNAMRILSDRRVDGMVKFLSAYDVPACVLMEYIKGVDLWKGIEQKKINRLGDALAVLHRTGQIVLAGHQLRERVLHRDLKPSNVMVRLPIGVDIASAVVVLDFDLSWYEGAVGRSVLQGERLNSYLAPEQTGTRMRDCSSRHTAVDVFGLGMLLYFVCTGEDPPLNAQNTVNFLKNVVQKILGRWGTKFVGSPLFLANLIQAATQDAQAARIGLPAFLDALALVKRAEDIEELEAPSDLAVAELGCSLERDIWEEDLPTLSAGRFRAHSLVSGASVEIWADAGGKESGLVVEISHVVGSSTSRRNVNKYLHSHADKAAAILRRNGVFYDVVGSIGQGRCSGKGLAVAGDWNRSRVRQLTQALGDAANTMAMEK
ncbi:SIR2 family protein [Thermodesulfobacteriota bacterium]